LHLHCFIFENMDNFLIQFFWRHCLPCLLGGNAVKSVNYYYNLKDPFYIWKYLIVIYFSEESRIFSDSVSRDPSDIIL